MDIWTKEKRSQVMSKIRGKNTRPERIVRRILTDMGFRYRLNVKTLPGKPDIVLRKYNAIILVHGCFWHLHSRCKDGRIPKSRTEYWKPKLLGNKERDKKNILSLRRQGWRILKIWECDIDKNPQKVINNIRNLFI